MVPWVEESLKIWPGWEFVSWGSLTIWTWANHWMALKFPSNAQIAELNKAKKLDEALDVFAQAIVQISDVKAVAQWCREYLSNNAVSRNLSLRKAVFYLIVQKRILVDSPVESVWDFVVRFGPQNESAVITYLDSAPRSVPLKLGRLLLYFAEFGKPNGLADDGFQRCLIVLLSSVHIAEAVTTPDWTKSIHKFRTNESMTILEVAQALDRGAPCWMLVTLFPQLSPSKAIALLRRTQLPIEQLSQHILDNPNFVDEVLKEPLKPQQRKRFVALDHKVRQAKEDAILKHNQQHFKYDFVSLEDLDPEPEDDGPSQPELSEADKKLASQEELLWNYWHSNKSVFDRTSRKSEARKQLCSKLKWTNEQVEGWGRVIGQKGRSELASDEVESYAPSWKAGPPIEESEVHQERHDEMPRGISKSSSHSSKNSSSNASKKPSQPAVKKTENSHKNSHNQRPKKSGKKNHSRPE